MTLAIALDLPNQQTNLSLGLCDSTEALYARSLLEGYAEAPTSDFIDTWFYNQGVCLKDTLAGSSARLGTAYNGKHLRLARALAFTKSVGGFSLGQDFDESELSLASSVATFFSQAATATILANSFVAAFDLTVGNQANATGSWTTVNPDTDADNFGVGFIQGGEWLEFDRPVVLPNGTYTVVANIARLSTTARGWLSDGVTLPGTYYDVPETGSWTTYALRTLNPAFVLDSSTTRLRITFDSAQNLNYIRLTQNT